MAKLDFDTAEMEPSRVCPLSVPTGFSPTSPGWDAARCSYESFAASFKSPDLAFANFSKSGEETLRDMDEQIENKTTLNVGIPQQPQKGANAGRGE